MKRFTLVLLALAAGTLMSACGDQGTANKTVNVSNTANSNANASPAAAEADIRKLLDTAAAALAKNDADTMDTIYADNYMLVNIDGSVQTKAERLAALRAGDPKYTAFTYDDVNVRLNPEATGAVVIARINMKGTNHGKPLDGYYRATQVYSKTKDGWRQVSAQATLITGATAPATTGSSTAANTNKMAANTHTSTNTNTNTTANSNSSMTKTNANTKK